MNIQDNTHSDVNQIELEPETEYSISLDQMIAGSNSDQVGRPDYSRIFIGTLTKIDQDGLPVVSVDSRQAASARSTVPLGISDIGQQVAVMFEQADPEKPLVMGVIQPPASQQDPSKPLPVLDAKVDNEHLTFTAKREIVFRCGKASITLTRAGKIILRGTYLLSRSAGVNRIKGGSVQIN